MEITGFKDVIGSWKIIDISRPRMRRNASLFSLSKFIPLKMIRPAVIRGVKFRDTNANQVRDAGEAGLEGWTIFLDADGDRTLDAGEVSTVTDSQGNYECFDLAAGTYTVAEVQQTGWEQTAPAGDVYSVTLADGETVDGRDFGNRELPAEIRGSKFNDLDGDGQRGAGEPGLEGWTIFLDSNNN